MISDSLIIWVDRQDCFLYEIHLPKYGHYMTKRSYQFRVPHDEHGLDFLKVGAKVAQCKYQSVCLIIVHRFGTNCMHHPEIA